MIDWSKKIENPMMQKLEVKARISGIKLAQSS